MDKHTQTFSFLLEGADIECEVEYTLSKGSPAVMYQRNGDPGWPAEPPELEVLNVSVSGQPVPIWAFKAIQESDRLYEYIVDNHSTPEREDDND